MRLKKLYYYCLFLFAGLFFTPAPAQNHDTANIFAIPVQMDSFVVSSGFDVQAFIRRVEHDTTFYKAFRSMRCVPYNAVNDIKAYDKNSLVIAWLHSNTRQEINEGCRVTKVAEQHTGGDFYKENSAYNYYTAELYDYLFFAKQPVCGETDVIGASMEDKGKGQMEKSKYELKQLIFNPGAKVSGIPFMGDRASVFEPDEARKYNFKITRELADGVECYVFRITPKAGFERKVIYNELTTWFRKTDYSIIARNYSLSYHTLFYDFDVYMKVRTREINGKLYPTYIDYDGNWHILMKKRERVKFQATLSY
jgi:hypothetical protein